MLKSVIIASLLLAIQVFARDQKENDDDSDFCFYDDILFERKVCDSVDRTKLLECHGEGYPENSFYGFWAVAENCEYCCDSPNPDENSYCAASEDDCNK